MILIDKRRWAAVDVNADEQLSEEEFISFLHTEESVHMKDIVVYETMDDNDMDKDTTYQWTNISVIQCLCYTYIIFLL